MSRYNAILENDVVNSESGVCVSFFVQGCPHRCPGCFNEETWDFNSGIEYTPEVGDRIVEAIGANGIIRDFALLGGEPLAPQNLKMVSEVTDKVREAYPDITIYCWTGYTYEELIGWGNPYFTNILNKINILIDGPFIEAEKDLSLRLRGSKNQHIRVNVDGLWKMEE